MDYEKTPDAWVAMPNEQQARAMMGSANRGKPVWSKALPDEGFIYAAWH